jgi:hypothetical protein
MARANQEMERPWSDPVVAEVRAAREALFAESRYDLRAFVARLRKDQKAAGHKAVTRVPRFVED